MTKALTLYCSHEWSFTGAEGSVRDLGRWPILWTCDACGWLILDWPSYSSREGKPPTSAEWAELRAMLAKPEPHVSGSEEN